MEEITYEKFYLYKKEVPKEEMNEKYNRIGNTTKELFNNPNINNFKGDFRDVIRYLNDKGVKFPLYCYFSEEKEIFIEIFTDEFPYKYDKENFIFDYIDNYFKETNFEKNINIDKFDDNKIKNKFYIKLVN